MDNRKLLIESHETLEEYICDELYEDMGGDFYVITNAHTEINQKLRDFVDAAVDETQQFFINYVNKQLSDMSNTLMEMASKLDEK